MLLTLKAKKLFLLKNVLRNTVKGLKSALGSLPRNEALNSSDTRFLLLLK